MQVPDDLRYTTNHEWIRDEGEGRFRVGITDFAQDALGDVVYVALPDVGRALSAGEAFGEVESTKSVSDVYAPVTGEVAAVNEALLDAPEAVNTDPYGDGWLIVIRSEAGIPDGLLDAGAYEAHTSS
ncbi:MAG: glycine cleavage system protein GcvH [Acidimicrobiia bacterium]